MRCIQTEPILDFHAHRNFQHHTSAIQVAQTPPPPDIDALVLQIQREFPQGQIRVTGRGRTVERQAELMAQRRILNRRQFLHTYTAANHITEMDRWVTSHPHASQEETASAFVDIINRARQRGAVVSNHLSDHARDISIPTGNHHFRNQVRSRLHELGGRVIDEQDAVGGPHWHIDY